MNLPIAERELRVASRDKKTYRGRFVVCIIFGAIAGWVIWFFGRYGMRATVGQNAFMVMTMVAFMIVIMSAQATADCLSSEKREGTLGFLFLTDLRGYDIVFGKLAAYGLTAIYGLVAAIPVISLPLLIGGVPLESVAKSAAGLLNTLFLSLSVGLFVSCKAFEQKKAMGRAMQWMMFFWIGIPLIAIVLEQKYRLREAAEWVRIFAPASQISTAGPFAIGLTRTSFWPSFIVVHLMAWAFLVSACLRLPKVWQDQPRETLKNRFLRWLDQLRYGKPEVRLGHRRRLLDSNAVYWLCGREVKAPEYMWGLMGLAIAAWIGITEYFKEQGANYASVGIPVVIVLCFILFLRVVGLATEVIARDRQTGALELLLSTRLTIGDLVRGHAQNIVRVCAGPIALTFGLGLFLLGLFVAQDMYERDEFIRAFIYLATIFGAALVSGFWTGLWQAASARIPGQAGGLVMVRIVVCPLILFVLLMSVGAWLGISVDGETAFTIWWLMILGNAAYWGVTSRQKFYENIRQIAAERFQPGAAEGWFAKLGRLWASVKGPAAAAGAKQTVV